MAILNNSNAISSGGYDINNSLRFRASASAYLNRTPAGAGNRKTWTWSAWIKRGALPGTEIDFFSASPSVDGAVIRFNLDNTMRGYDYNGGFAFNFVTTQVFRDPSAWYHIVFAYDSTQATSGNRFKVYVNGNQVTSFSSTTYPSLNQDTYWFNNANVHNIGRNSWSGVSFFDGYLADVNFIDGSAKAASDFGETDTTTGSWKPKAYTGTYGTNGFYLKFSDIATTSGSNAGLGKDFSGNANYWTTNNISVTAGTTYDAMTDVPTLTSATVANYCVLNSAAPSYRAGGTSTISNGNLTSTDNASSYGLASVGTISISSGKWYWEVNATSIGGSYGYIGIAKTDTLSLGSSNIEGYIYSSLGYKASGAAAFAGIPSATYGASWTTGDVIGIALDMDAGTLVFYKNGASQGTAYTGITGEYVAGLGDGQNATAYTFNINFGQRPFAYTPPTGFVALNTYNLPDSTIKKGSSYMDAILYTGNGTNGRAITTGMATDFVWVKKRSASDNNELQDRVRGAAKRLQSNSTAAEVAISAVASFTSTGFTVDGWGTTNENGFTYVAWSWLANGSGSTNTSGSITSTVSVNTTAGFSVVTYTGVGGAGTIGHGLGVAPKFIITKYRNIANGWYCYHTSAGTGNVIILNSTAATVADAAFNSTAPTSSVFSVGSINTNQSTGTYVAYCWAEIAGFSKFGSYTGNGSADGPFVYLGFRPSWILIKSSSAASTNWWVLDDARNTYNLANLNLIPNDPSVELNNSTYFQADFLSNGFKLRSTGQSNTSAATYIYAAFAENPFKNANAR